MSEASPKQGFLDDTVRVLLALRRQPQFPSDLSELVWYRQLYVEAEKLWAARAFTLDEEAFRKSGPY